VLIVDFSYPREQLLTMKQVAASLEVLDHHKTAQAALEGLDFRVFDQSKSGGRLTWEWFYPHEPSPGLVDYTEDRDLWLWKLPGSKAVNAALRSYPLDFKLWDRLGALSGLELCAQLLDEGEAILRAEAAIVQAHVNNAFEVEIEGHKVLCVNATTMISEIGGKLAEGRPFGMTWFEGDDNERVYSLRSREGGIDVSEIAKKHGGGGHRNAAGFRAPATGATGLFTHGKSRDDDEGEVKCAIGVDQITNLVVLDFGKPVAWLSIPKAGAKALAAAIDAKADLLQ
jgi:oligoribonuclease NrnB/cAMP/cGMP phosphodiesterase (DHH superfamily)